MSDYFEVMFLLSKIYNWSIAEQENMVPWERNIYVALAFKDINEEVKRKELASGTHTIQSGHQIIVA